MKSFLTRKGVVFFLLVFSSALTLMSGSVLADHDPNRQYAFHWVNSTTIELSGAFSGTFTYGGTGESHAAFVGTTNFSVADADCDKSTELTLNIKKEDYEHIDTSQPTQIASGTTQGESTCDFSEDVIQKNLRDGAYFVGFTDETDLEGFSTQGSGDGEEETNCESAAGAWGWIQCPVVRGLDAILGFLEGAVGSLLEINPEYYAQRDENGEPTELYTAWSIIRNIAYTVLIPIMLIMVLGTALGFEIFSAYTVKKALPRLMVAVIFIALSWNLTTFAVDVTNALGSGISGIITAPFRANYSPGDPCSQELDLGCFFGADSGFTTGAALTTILSSAIQAGLAIIGLLGFLIFYGSVLILAFALGLLVLMARQLFIIALILVAPLAILAWIFPGNDKFWNAWWSFFSKLLIMYPLIMLLISTGSVFAWIISRGL